MAPTSEDWASRDVGVSVSDGCDQSSWNELSATLRLYGSAILLVGVILCWARPAETVTILPTEPGSNVCMKEKLLVASTALLPSICMLESARILPVLVSSTMIAPSVPLE